MNAPVAGTVEVSVLWQEAEPKKRGTMHVHARMNFVKALSTHKMDLNAQKHHAPAARSC